MKRISPSMEKAQALNELLKGKNINVDGKSLLSELVKLSVEKTLQEALEQEQADYLGRERYERGLDKKAYRNGYEPEHSKRRKVF